MRGWLLDTNAVINLFRRPDGPVAGRLASLPTPAVYLSAVVLHELDFGTFRSRDVESGLAEVDTLPFPRLDFTAADARTAARIRPDLAACGKPIGGYDLFIAAQALTRDLTLVMHNTREFARVEGLRIEDWETP